jgi:glucokinase
MDEGTYIGIDLGGTKTQISLLIKDEIFESFLFPTEIEKGADAIIATLIEHIEVLKKKTKTPIQGIGIGIAGQVDKDGMVIFGTNLNWKNIPLKSILESKTKTPVAITNDVRAATWGEWLLGAGRGYQDIVCVFMGTGIGGGLVANGQVLNGCNNSAGEIGHMVVKMHGDLCSCGNHGCLETIASGWAIAKKAKKNISTSPYLLEKMKANHNILDAKMVVEAFHQQDSLSINIINEAIETLSIGCVNLVNVLGPQVLILGGGVLSGLPEMTQIIWDKIKKQALQAATQKLVVKTNGLGKNAGVTGAALFAKYSKDK